MAETAIERLTAIANRIRAGDEPPAETVRTLLSWFGAQRRGSVVVWSIRDALDRAELLTDPDFEDAYIDSLVQFRPRVSAQAVATGAAATTASAVGASTREPSSPPPPGPSPPTNLHVDSSFRLRKLAAANRTPLSIKPDAPLSEAITLMLSRDYSQLPVMTTERDVKGAISWRSVATRLALKRDGSSVREFMDSVEILQADASLFDAIRVIVQQQYVLVQETDKRIVGIVTSSDLSAQFQQLTEPFLLLSEIENSLRRALHSKFTADELAQVKDPVDMSRQIQTPHDMTFGEYIVLLEKPERWSKLGLVLDRGVFLERLKQVRNIRNDVMHFDPDPIGPEDLERLRDFAKLLQRLRELGVT